MKFIAKRFIFTLALGLGLFASSASTSALNAGGVTGVGLASTGQACNTLTTIDSSQDCNTKSSAVNTIVGEVVNILSLIVGIVAVIVIIVSGLRFITAAGDSSKVSSARTSLIYALIGVAVAVLAQFLVHFVINTSNNSLPGSCKSDTSLAASDSKCK